MGCVQRHTQKNSDLFEEALTTCTEALLNSHVSSTHTQKEMVKLCCSEPLSLYGQMDHQVDYDSYRIIVTYRNEWDLLGAPKLT